MSPRKVSLLVSMGIVAIIVLSISGKLVETNRAGYYQVKQAFVTGKMTVRMDPGVYMQNLGDIYEYKAVATVGFGEEYTGEGSADIDAIPVIFNDGSKADISGLIRVKLPSNPDELLKLKNQYAQGYEHFIRSGVVPIVQNAVKLAANLRSAQDAYTTLATFQQDIDDQLRNGVYVTKADKQFIPRSTGDVEEIKVTVIARDENDEPLRLADRFNELGCELLECVISIPKFDAKVDEMIGKRKDEAMKTELAKQEAIRAKQDAITSEEQGKANVAKAKYEKEVEKVKEVTEAQKLYEVEKLNAQKALETAKKIKAEGMAEAAANQALVSAGLTPQERAEWAYKTQVGVAAELAKVQFPSTMILGGGANGGAAGAMDPFTAIGLNSFLDISEKISKKGQK